MEVFVWVTAGVPLVYKANNLEDLKFLVNELNEKMSMWDIVFMPIGDLLRAHNYGSIDAAKKAIMDKANPIITDYSDDRFETGTGFTKVIANV